MPSPALHFWRAPLVPVALFVTGGIVLDRYLSPPFLFSFAFSLAAWLAWVTLHNGPDRGLAVIYLWAGCFGLGALYHHWYLHSVPLTDIRHLASEEMKPARLRGVIHSEPGYQRGSGADPLRSFPTSGRTKFVLGATALRDGSDWLIVSGLVQVTVDGRVQDAHVGDRVEVVGRLSLPEGPVNPGGFDYAAALHDKGIGVMLQVRADEEGILLLDRGWPASFFGWLAVIRGWGQEQLERYLPKKVAGLGSALLLGESPDMTSDDWEKYMRTGVIHVLAISGQHLVVLSVFLWWILRLAPMPRRYGALVIAALLMLYALLAGGRPPVMRSAWAVAVYCGGLWLQRPVFPSSVFAFAWIGVLVCNPTDVFNSGCLLSFTAVAVLIWGVGRMKRPTADPLQKLIEESRPWPLRWCIRIGREVGWFYLVNALVWLAVTPLAAERFNVVAPAALILGPPLVLLTSFALIGGFLLLLTSPILGPLAYVIACPTGICLALCELLVDWALTWPLGYFYVADVPDWWAWVYYGGLFLLFTVDRLRDRARYLIWLAAGWLVLGLILVLWPTRSREFRCTFLAVGHGGCTVIETPGGKTLLYDAGTIAGPDVTRRHIAPYLWSRGIRRIDEVFLSHGDLDHFNGLLSLLERFQVDRVSCTPTFADLRTRAATVTLEAIENRGISLRILKSGDVLEIDGIAMEVLHPLPQSPVEVFKNENARSLVLDCRYEDLTILLTGDLDGGGLARVLSLPPRRVDVLMAPHHGGKITDPAGLAKWAKASIVVSCQEPPRMKPKAPNDYEKLGARYLTTAAHGAVTVRKEDGTWITETFLSKKKRPLK